MKYKYWLRYGIPTTLILLCLTSRLLFIGQYLGEWDEVDFALALRDFDIVAQQPHFPGYPVYIWFSKIAMHLTKKDEVSSLTLVSAFFGGLTVLPLYLLALSMYSRRVAVIATCLFLTNPACWLYSERPLSEATALFFLLFSLYFIFLSTKETVNPRVPLLGILLMGITLGVRLDYFPFLICLFYVLTYSHRRYSIFELFCFSGVFILGVMLWLVPIIMALGLETFCHQALDFTRGHFTDWGGSVVTASDPTIRVGHLLWSIFPAGFGLWWIDLSYIHILPSIYLIYGFYMFMKGNSYGPQKRFIFITLLPYFLWLFLAQNIEKPRHVLPLIPLLTMTVSAGILQRPINMNKLGLLVLTMTILGAFSLRLVYDYSRSIPPLMQLVTYVQSPSGGFDPLSTRVYCGETKRLFEYYAPGWDARRVRNSDELIYDFQASLCPPPNLLITSEVKIDAPPSNSTSNASDISCSLHGRKEADTRHSPFLQQWEVTLKTFPLKHIKSFRGEKYIYSPYNEITLLGIDSHAL